MATETPAPDLFSARWGPALDNDDRSGMIVIPRDWRSTVAAWPHDRWCAWRRRSLELQPPGPTADEIRAADHAAYLELA